MIEKQTEFSNSKIKNRIRILEKSKDKLVFRTFLDADGGQDQLHYHSKINERFTVVAGDLNLIIGKKKTILNAGSEITISPFTNHMFYNTSDEEVIFDVTVLKPKQLINALQIFYGLNNDGKTNRAGLPKNIFHIAIGLKMMNTFSPKVPYKLQKLGINLLAHLSKIFGIEKRLVAKYCF